MFVHDAILEALTCGDTQIDTKKKIKEMNEFNPQTHLTEFETQFRVCTARSEEKTLFYCYPSTRCWKRCPLNQMRSVGARLSNIPPRIAVTSTYLVCDHYVWCIYIASMCFCLCHRGNDTERRQGGLYSCCVC